MNEKSSSRIKSFEIASLRVFDAKVSSFTAMSGAHGCYHPKPPNFGNRFQHTIIKM